MNFFPSDIINQSILDIERYIRIFAEQVDSLVSSEWFLGPLVNVIINKLDFLKTSKELLTYNNNDITDNECDSSLLTLFEVLIAFYYLKSIEKSSIPIECQKVLAEIVRLATQPTEFVYRIISYLICKDIYASFLGNTMLESMDYGQHFDRNCNMFSQISNTSKYVNTKDEEADLETSSFKVKLLLLDFLALLYFHCKEKILCTGYPLGKILTCWKKTIDVRRLHSHPFQSSLNRWLEKAPEIFLGMFLNDNSRDGWKFVWSNHHLLSIGLQQPFGYQDLVINEAHAILFSTDSTNRNELICLLGNYLIDQLQNNSTKSDFSTQKIGLFQLLNELIESIDLRWTRSIEVQSSDPISHLIRIFSTLSTKNRDETADILTMSFELQDDVEMSSFLVGLVLCIIAKSKDLDVFFYLGFSAEKITDIPILLASLSISITEDSTLSKAFNLWKICINQILGINRSEPFANVATHTATLLKIFGVLSGLEKVISVCLPFVKEENAFILTHLQSIQSLKFGIAFSLRQLKYSQLYLGSGSIGNLSSTRDDLGLLVAVQELYEDSLYRGSLEDIKETPVAATLASEAAIIKYAIPRTNLPMSFAFLQFQKCVQVIHRAKSDAQPLLTMSQITEIKENSINDDAWWEISLCSLIASCHTAFSSFEEFLNAADENKYAEALAHTDFSELLTECYRGYQLLISQDEQDTLKRIMLKVRKIREAAGSTNNQLGRHSTSESGKMILFEKVLFHDLEEKRGLASRSNDSDDNNDEEILMESKPSRLRRALTLSSTKKQFASSMIAKKLAAKLVAHPSERYIASCLYDHIVAPRPKLPIGEEGSNPLFQPIEKLLHCNIQELLWTLRAEWLLLLDLLVKITLKRALNTMSYPHMHSVVSNQTSPPNKWLDLLHEMLELFSAEIMHSAVVGVNKVVFENMVEVVYAVSRALHPADRLLPIEYVLERRRNTHLTSSRHLARMLVVLQEVGASAEQKLQRALLNLALQLSGADYTAWKIAIPFLVSSCLIRWEKTHVFSSQVDDSDFSESSDENGVISENEEPPVKGRRRNMIEEQVEMLDAYLQIQTLQLQQTDSAEACLMMMPEVRLASCYLKVDEKVAESLWLEIFRRMTYEIKASSQIVQSPDFMPSMLLSTGNEEHNTIRDGFIASKELAMHTEVFISIFRTLLLETSIVTCNRNRKRKHKVDDNADDLFGDSIWECLPWKCKVTVLSHVNLILRLLSQEVKRILKPVPVPIKVESTADASVSILEILPTIGSLSTLKLNKEVHYDEEKHTNALSQNSSKSYDDVMHESEFDDNNNSLTFSRIPILNTLLTKEDDMQSMSILLLVKQYMLRDQFGIQQRLAVLQRSQKHSKSQAVAFQYEQNDEGEDELDVDSPLQRRRPPPASVARLLGLSSNYSKSAPTKVSSAKLKSPDNSEGTASKKAQKQLEVELQIQLKKYAEILEKFTALENDFIVLQERAKVLEKDQTLGDDFEEILAGTRQMCLQLQSTTSYSNSPTKRKNKRMKFMGGEEDNAVHSGEKKKASKTVTIANKVTKKNKLTKSRNTVVNEWLKETDGNDDFADLEDFLV